VLDWDSVIHKNVSSSDGEPAGNIVAVEGDMVFIESSGDRVHLQIPKSVVAGYNGAEVTLNKPRSELREYVKG
jgi:hypothetical protein